MRLAIKAIHLLVVAFSTIAPLVHAQTPVQADANEAMRAEAMKLINAAEPTFGPALSAGEKASKIETIKLKIHEKKFRTKDDTLIHARHLRQDRSSSTVVLVHGALSDSSSMDGAARLLREATGAEVIAVDLRGHGRSGGTSGDVSYIDQYSEDLATIVASIRSDRPKNKIFLAGHSMGGGVCLRFAMRKEKPPVDGFILFAPLLGQNTPTYPDPPAAGSLESRAEPFLKVHFERIIGLKILNSIGEHKFDTLPVLFFNPPGSVRFRNYTYRANESMAPADYKEGLKAISSPLLVLVGSADEAFKASAFKDAVESNSVGKAIIIDGATHSGVLEDRRSLDAIKKWVISQEVNSKQR